MVAFLAYIGLCLIIALIGSNRKFGFWGYLFCSLAFTPCIGLIILLASDKRKKEAKECPVCASAMKTKERMPEGDRAAS